MIIDGKAIAEKIYQELISKIRFLKTNAIWPGLAVILVGDDPDSKLYVNVKARQAQKLGIRFLLKHFSTQVPENKILDCLGNLSQDAKVNGIIVQMPLPKNFQTKKILEALDIQKDVDNLTGQSKFPPPTPRAILKIFEEYKINFENKKILIVGKGRLVGGPLANMLSSQGINFEIADRDTQDLKTQTLEADILISSTGQNNLITADMVKPGAAVIDTNRDVEFDQVVEKASLITPAIGGVGPITVAYLLKNVVKAARIQNDLD